MYGRMEVLDRGVAVDLTDARLDHIGDKTVKELVQTCVAELRSWTEEAAKPVDSSNSSHKRQDQEEEDDDERISLTEQEHLFEK
jgi:hypothetical protein